jgi:hypothetical protein
MNNNSDLKDQSIIDLDADQVVEDTHKPAAAEEPTPRQRKPWLLPGMALLAGAVGGGYLYKDVLASYFPSDQTLALSQKLSVLEQDNAALKSQVLQIEQLSARLNADLDTLEEKQATLSGFADAAQQSQITNAEKFAALDQSLAESKQRLADLLARPVAQADGTAPVDTTALTALQLRITSLEKDVESLKAKTAEPPDNAVALSQSLSDLKAKITAGAGYSTELDQIQRMVPAAAGLDVLAQHASGGIPDAKGLAGELKALIPDLPKPIVPGPVPESEGWWAAIYDSLSSLITIRIEGDVDWPSAAAAAVALAEAGDLPQAMEQLNNLEGDKPSAIRQWMDRAQARLNVDQALQSVEEAVLRVIAAKG